MANPRRSDSERPIIYTRALLNRQRQRGILDAETLKFVEKMVKRREARLRRAATKRLRAKLHGPRNAAYATPDTEEVKGLQVKLAKLLLKLRSLTPEQKLMKLRGVPARRRRPSKKVQKLRDAIQKASARL